MKEQYDLHRVQISKGNFSDMHKKNAKSTDT
jgi:hypothetical protein